MPTCFSLCSSYSVKIGVGENNGYTRPMNVDFLGAAYLFYGFIPADVARQRTTQGIQVCNNYRYVIIYIMFTIHHVVDS